MRPVSPSSLLKSVGTQALLITNPTNIRYLSGVEVSAGYLLVTQRKYSFYVDGRYLEIAQKKCEPSVTVLSQEKLENSLRKLTTCGVESQDLTVSRYRRIKRKYKNTKFVLTSGIVEEFRRQKDTEELKKFRRAQRITRELMRRVPAYLRKSPTENALALQLELWARELGADGLAFEPVVAFGTHSSRPHHRSSARRLRKGMIVQIDVGARYKGYCADQSEVFFTQKPTSQQQRVLEAVKKAKDTAMDAVRAGVRACDLQKIAIEVLSEYGLDEYFVHALGHGLGLEVHEGVSLRLKSKEKLSHGEIITIEPGVYIPGKFGIRLEEEVIVQ